MLSGLDAIMKGVAIRNLTKMVLSRGNHAEFVAPTGSARGSFGGAHADLSRSRFAGDRHHQCGISHLLDDRDQVDCRRPRYGRFVRERIQRQELVDSREQDPRLVSTGFSERYQILVSSIPEMRNSSAQRSLHFIFSLSLGARLWGNCAPFPFILIGLIGYMKTSL
ncbi:MAG: hypothetical protein A3F68_12390 [Acidobacteria bacterium RIFCSPLOWO2_12_FULL_54_10]|nr:MAG: hypothetical protein A3F68_12390 [Acidobacteria bacterium RIFCSPLOWO2_12_FULL_54_10]